MSSAARTRTRARYQAILAEHSALADAIDWAGIDALAAAMLEAERIFLSGQGRSGLMIRAIAIRLMHIGLTVHVAGEPSTPAIGPGDLLLAISASAKTQATLTHMEVARRTGATVALVSATPPSSPMADMTVEIPARTKVATDQHAGSLFEQGLLLIGDALAWHIQQLRDVPDSALDRRHANLQ